MRLATGMPRYIALAMLLIYAGLLFAGIDLVYWDGYAPASGFAPVWVAISGLILATLMLFDIGAEPVLEDGPILPSREEFRRVVLALAALWLFVVAAPFLGMIPAALALMLFLLLVVLGRPLLPSLLTAFVTDGLIYLIFIHWLNVQLPRGIFGI
ncbi:tripartite tricarboxylate transporter TctB family protein [Starkeya koreensis]|uniref:Tripartite tricarboxylate transporter TctB family protein n=1 Tax=Ancylobacter koreensis TaxID=266121 RepID=A0ABT0DR05_9HYPH|nr:tripartite tricarboxylate transporter TctB family protein [Ancylobacter koreensis]MCK0209714.1 tripartite tricarboxylate transporter TctB family protein [Ancylobacter koreensis]